MTSYFICIELFTDKKPKVIHKEQNSNNNNTYINTNLQYKHKILQTSECD